jgi:CBS domain-containing protein
METSLIVVPSRIRHMGSVAGRIVPTEEPCLAAQVSALFAMTDFRREHAITVTAQLSIDDALAKMKRRHVHALLVVMDDPAESDVQVLGLITACDILRERPHRSTDSNITVMRKSLLVREVMTTWDDLSLINHDSLQSLTAADAHEMFKGTGLTHLLVVEHHDATSAVALGILSRGTLSKRLRESATARWSSSSWRWRRA